MKKKEPLRFEFSAGGVVMNPETKRLLLVRVKNLQGQEVWTFPKGHIEQGERAAEAALREGAEETGWRCNIVSSLKKVQYWFKRDGGLVKKAVTWFLMEPRQQVGERDPQEILEVRWASPEEAEKIVSYKSDFELLKELEKRRASA